MGTLVNAYCDCGYKHDLSLGSGFQRHKRKVKFHPSPTLFVKCIQFLFGRESLTIEEDIFYDYTPFPYYCGTCESLININVGALAKECLDGEFCPECIDFELCCPACKSFDILPYSDESICADEGKCVFSYIGYGKDFCVTTGKYLCPKCQKFTMSFRNAGRFC